MLLAAASVSKRCDLLRKLLKLLYMVGANVQMNAQMLGSHEEQYVLVGDCGDRGAL